MSSNEAQITTRIEERRTEYTEPDPKKISMAREIKGNMAGLANQLGSAKSRVQSVHSLMNSVSSGSVLNLRSDSHSTYNRAKAGAEKAAANAKQASSAAGSATTTRRMEKIERVRLTYEDGRLVSQEVVSVDHRQLD